MIEHDLAGDGQTEPHPFADAARGHVRREKALPHPFGNARAVVGDIEADLLSSACQAECDAAAALCHRL